MSVPVQEAAAVLTPLLSVGADAALRELASQAGSTISKPATRVIEKIGKYLPGANPSRGEVERALESGLASGAISGNEVTLIAESQQAGRDIVNNRAKTIFSGNTFNVSGNFDVGGD
jgi:hypothetical protein